jgi:5'-deoxynucleotidase
LASFRELEAVAVAKLASTIPTELAPEYAQLMTRATADEDPLTVYVRAADKLAAYLKCVSEVAAGNREFIKAKTDLHDRLVQLDMPEIGYFLRTFAPDFERVLDDLA